MKTAMQFWIKWANGVLNNPNYKDSPRLKEGIRMGIVKATELLEKEKQRIIDAYESGVKMGESYIPNHGYERYTDSEDYYTQTFPKTNPIE